MELSKYSMYYTLDEPVPFLKKVLIYPVQVKDYQTFHWAVECLLIIKNRIPDINIIKMTYLDFLYHKMIEEQGNPNYMERVVMNQFYTLLSLALNIEMNQIKVINKNNCTELIITYDENNIVTINSSEFDEIKAIICEYQNIELPDETVSPAFEQAIREAREYKSKNSAKMCSLEDQICIVLLKTGLNLEGIKQLSIRKFSKILERADHELHYKIYKQAEMNGAEFKTKIDHWMSELNKDKYEGLIVGYDDTVNKFK